MVQLDKVTTTTDLTKLAFNIQTMEDLGKVLHQYGLEIDHVSKSKRHPDKNRFYYENPTQKSLFASYSEVTNVLRVFIEHNHGNKAI